MLWVQHSSTCGIEAKHHFPEHRSAASHEEWNSRQPSGQKLHVYFVNVNKLKFGETISIKMMCEFLINQYLMILHILVNLV